MGSGEAALAVAACARYQPLETVVTPVGFTEGPGLFTGAAGEWVIYRR